MGMRIHWDLRPSTELDRFAAQWDQLNLADAGLPILDAAFWRIALGCFGNGSEQLAIASAGGQPIAAGVFESPRAFARNLFQPGQAPLGPWLFPESSRCSLDELLESLRAEFGLRCNLVGLSQQDPRFHPPPVDSRSLRTVPYIETASVDTSGEFSAYWESRGKNLRQNLRKQRNRLERQGRDTRLVQVTGAADIVAAIEAYASLELSGWKAEEGTAITPTGSQGRFYKALMAHYAGRGEAVVFQYHFDDQLVASDLCLHRGGTLIILKTAFDSTIESFSPALLLREEMFQRFFASESVRRVEFYGRLMEWHTRWTEDVRELYHLNYTTALSRIVRALRGS